MKCTLDCNQGRTCRCAPPPGDDRRLVIVMVLMVAVTLLGFLASYEAILLGSTHRTFTGAAVVVGVAAAAGTVYWLAGLLIRCAN